MQSPTFPANVTHSSAHLDPATPRPPHTLAMQRCHMPGQREDETFLLLDGNQAEAFIHALYAERNLEHEHLLVLMGDRFGHIYGVQHVASGEHRSIQSDVDRVYTSARAFGAAYIIAVHNHPAGEPAADLAASEDDQCLTAHLISAGRTLGIELVDHIIYMGDGRCASTRMQCPDLWADAPESDAATTTPGDEH